MVSDAPAIPPAIILVATPGLSLLSIFLVSLALRAEISSFDVDMYGTTLEECKQQISLLFLLCGQRQLDGMNEYHGFLYKEVHKICPGPMMVLQSWSGFLHC